MSLSHSGCLVAVLLVFAQLGGCRTVIHCHSDTCYQFHSNLVTWTEAEHHCDVSGWSLSTRNPPWEVLTQPDVVRIGAKQYWLSATGVTQQRQWTWPPDGSLNEKLRYCQVSNLTTDTPAFGLGHCHELHNYICEIRQPTTCRYTRLGTEYVGTLSLGRTGGVCARWEDKQGMLATSYTFPEGDIKNSNNYCRNPDITYKQGPWCFPENSTKYGIFAPCNVSYCQEKLPECGLGNAVTPSRLACDDTRRCFLASESSVSWARAQSCCQALEGSVVDLGAVVSSIVGQRKLREHRQNTTDKFWTTFGSRTWPTGAGGKVACPYSDITRQGVYRQDCDIRLPFICAIGNNGTYTTTTAKVKATTLVMTSSPITYDVTVVSLSAESNSTLNTTLKTDAPTNQPGLWIIVGVCCGTGVIIIILLIIAAIYIKRKTRSKELGAPRKSRRGAPSEWVTTIASEFQFLDDFIKSDSDQQEDNPVQKMYKEIRKQKEEEAKKQTKGEHVTKVNHVIPTDTRTSGDGNSNERGDPEGTPKIRANQSDLIIEVNKKTPGDGQDGATSQNNDVTDKGKEVVIHFHRSASVSEPTKPASRSVPVTPTTPTQPAAPVGYVASSDAINKIQYSEGRTVISFSSSPQSETFHVEGRPEEKYHVVRKPKPAAAPKPQRKHSGAQPKPGMKKTSPHKDDVTKLSSKTM